eukprot:5176846-Amphidinium_carterae.1
MPSFRWTRLASCTVHLLRQLGVPGPLGCPCVLPDVPQAPTGGKQIRQLPVPFEILVLVFLVTGISCTDQHVPSQEPGPPVKTL